MRDSSIFLGMCFLPELPLPETFQLSRPVVERPRIWLDLERVDSLLLWHSLYKSARSSCEAGTDGDVALPNGHY
jgi:hypothetical protein